MIVSVKDMERSLARVRVVAHGRAGGVFGPGSWAWRINRESIALLAGGAAALLQLAHPYVAYAVAQHSRTRADTAGRFRRTFDNVLTMAFGDLESACQRAMRVHRIHTRIRGRITEDAGRFPAGHEYQANDAQALLWVHATLVCKALDAYQLVFPRLEDAQREAYYQESKRFAYLFGIPDELIPHDLLAFQRYMDEMLASDIITVTRPARAMAHFLLSGTDSWDAALWRTYRAVTASFLPQRLRADFGLSSSRPTRVLVRAGTRLAAPLYRALPGSARFFPQYLDAIGHGVPRRRPSDAAQRMLRAILAHRTSRLDSRASANVHPVGHTDRRSR